MSNPMEDAAKAAIEQLMEESPAYWWLSFCDTEKDDDRFMGVLIIKARGLMNAVKKGHDLGVNPGGEVMAARIEMGTQADEVMDEYLDRLLTKEEAEECDAKCEAMVSGQSDRPGSGLEGWGKIRQAKGRDSVSASWHGPHAGRVEGQTPDG